MKIRSTSAANRRTGFVVLLLGCVVLSVAVKTGLPTSSAEAQTASPIPSDFTQQVRLATGNTGDDYASRLAISGNTAIVGSSAGVYVYVRSGDTWSQQALLVPSDGTSALISWVAIDGDTVVVGGNGATVNGNGGQGAAYVFVRGGSTWTEQQRLIASDGASFDRFGTSVAISGNTIAIGAPPADIGNSVDQGAAYVYIRNAGIWTEQQKLVATDGDHHNYFGHRVNVDGDKLAVSRARSMTAAVINPAVYVFIRSGISWQHQQRLSVCEPSALGLCFFGNSIAVKDNLLAVGNLFVNEGTQTAVGAVYVFERSSGSWDQQQKLLPDVIATNSLYGSAVAIDGPIIVVGAESDFGGPGSGSTYIYARPAAQWTQQQKLQVPGRAYWDSFGGCVSLSGNTLIVGAPRDNGSSPYIGAAYVFVSGSAPTPTPTPTVTVEFSASLYSVGESDPRVNLTVTRSGNTSGSATVGFATIDAAGLQNCNVFNGIASPRCDYSNTIGSVQFVAGETSKSFSVAVLNDSYAEGNENFTIALNNPTGASLVTQSTTTVMIVDNETVTGANPIDQTDFFVRQQYVDFLGREPDPPGFVAWVNTINNCPAGDTSCDRIHVSGIFFQSAEFRQRGLFVYLFYPVSFGRKPDYAEFVVDLARVSGFLSDAQLEAAKVQFIADFIVRPAYMTKYNSLNNTQYVDTLLATAAVTLSSRQTMIDGLNAGTLSRAQVLRQISESAEVSQKYFNQAFAVMEYFGYLRRDPDAFYLDWILFLDSGASPRAMVTGFVNSPEYRQRFGP